MTSHHDLVAMTLEMLLVIGGWPAWQGLFAYAAATALGVCDMPYQAQQRQRWSNGLQHAAQL